MLWPGAERRSASDSGSADCRGAGAPAGRSRPRRRGSSPADRWPGCRNGGSPRTSRPPGLRESLSCSLARQQAAHREGGPGVASFEIKTAEEFAARDPQSRWLARRAARETAEFRSVLQLFVDRGGPIPLQEIALGLRDPRARQLLTALDEEDLIRLQGDHVDVAYPFTALPTAFVVQL